MPRAAEKTPEQAPEEVQDLDQSPDTNSWEFVESLIKSIQIGDSQRLMFLIETYPTFRDQIIAQAQSTLGNATVEGALALMNVQAQPQGGQGAPPPDLRDQYADQVATAPAVGGAPDLVDEYADQVANAPAPTEAATPDLQQAPDPTSWEDTVRFQVLAATTAEELAVVLKGFPQYRQQILEASQLGDSENERAVQMADAPTAATTEEPAPPSTAESGPQPGDVPTQADPQSERDLQEEPAWIGRARAYNFSDDNVAYSVEFNTLTLGAFMANGEPDPVMIAAWQQDNGLDPDGRIGPQTVAKAQEITTKQVGSAPSQDDKISVDEMKKEVE